MADWRDRNHVLVTKPGKRIKFITNNIRWIHYFLHFFQLQTPSMGVQYPVLVTPAFRKLYMASLIHYFGGRRENAVSEKRILRVLLIHFIQTKISSSSFGAEIVFPFRKCCLRSRRQIALRESSFNGHELYHKLTVSRKGRRVFFFRRCHQRSRQNVVRGAEERLTGIFYSNGREYFQVHRFKDRHRGT